MLIATSALADQILLAVWASHNAIPRVPRLFPARLSPHANHPVVFKNVLQAVIVHRVGAITMVRVLISTVTPMMIAVVILSVTVVNVRLHVPSALYQLAMINFRDRFAIPHWDCALNTVVI